jgi:hypothetical protein
MLYYLFKDVVSDHQIDQVDNVNTGEIRNIRNHVMPKKIVSSFIFERRVFTWFLVSWIKKID